LFSVVPSKAIVREIWCHKEEGCHC